MTLDEMIKNVDALCEVHAKISAQQFTRKDEALQYLGWAIVGLSETIWHKGLGIEA